MNDIKRTALATLLALSTIASTALAGPPEKTATGLIYESLKDGSGAQPTGPKSVVQVHYRGTLADGTEFDSSYKRGQPAAFPLNQVIHCWTEGVARMKEGGKARLICPPDTAYGARGAGKAVPPNATITFEVELLKVVQ
jgi:FKBP-type peptidyl-prolyl cis-trans isomerase FkpA